MMFEVDKEYKRRELHHKYGGQWQGGISTPASHPLILIFTGPTGARYGYKDEWIDEEIFLYTGEGQIGDMTFIKGNKAIWDHETNKKDLHLFEITGKSGFVRYVGQMECRGKRLERGPDEAGNDRQIIRFELHRRR